MTLARRAQEVAVEIKKRSPEEGEPKDLTLIHGSEIRDWKTKDAQHFAHVGVVKR